MAMVFKGLKSLRFHEDLHPWKPSTERRAVHTAGSCRIANRVTALEIEASIVGGYMAASTFDFFFKREPFLICYSITAIFCLDLLAVDRGVWQATVHGVVKSWTRLSDKAPHSTSGISAPDQRLNVHPLPNVDVVTSGPAAKSLILFV